MSALRVLFIGARGRSAPRARGAPSTWGSSCTSSTAGARRAGRCPPRRACCRATSATRRPRAPPVGRLPIVESTPLRNPIWPYLQDKIACEELLVRAYREDGFPATIVRPSHTYDHANLPFDGGWTVVERMRQGGDVVVHGDGTSLWTLTHHVAFAKAFVGLLGHPQAIGDSFHITSDEVLTWNQIYELVAAAAGAEPRLVHVTSDAIFAADERWGRSLLGDKAHSVIFDNAKVRALVPDYVATIPFAHGAREIVAWHDEDPARRVVDERVDALMDALVAGYGRDA